MNDRNQLEILNECRQMMTKRMRSTITGMLNEIDETLLRMAQSSDGGLQESQCYEAVREIRLKRTEIKLRFERRFINMFDAILKAAGEEANQTENEISKTELITKNELFRGLERAEEDSIKKSVSAVSKNCSEVLLDLDRKISALISDVNTNPVRPEFIFEAFHEACWDIKSGEDIRQMMFLIFEKRISTELQSIYQDLNEFISGKVDTCFVVDQSPPEQQLELDEGRSAIMVRYEVITRIETRLEGQAVPNFVRHFLLKHWRLFLEKIYTKYSENSIAWNAARQTMDDLVWSVNRGTSLYDRQRLVQLLPSLLFRLINGMNVTGMKESEMEAFLAELKAFQLNMLDTEEDNELVESITRDVRNSMNKKGGRVYH